MLFKLADQNGKFIGYKSVCLPDDKMAGAATYVTSQLQKTNFPRNVTSSLFNAYSYLKEPIIISCYNKNFTALSCTLTEIPSAKRQCAIDKAKNKAPNYELKTKSPKYTVTTAGTSTNTTSFTISYAPTYSYSQYYINGIV